MSTPDSAPKAETLEFTPFTDLNNVPEEIALHQGGRLTIEMINAVVTRAYESATVPHFPNMGTAWAEFEQAHEIKPNESIWSAKTPEANT